MFPQYDSQTRQMLTGNILLVGCCIFYLVWWIVAFKPENPIKGLKSGWMLIPAAAFGLAAVIQIVRGSNVNSQTMLFSRSSVLIGGIIAYIVLLAATLIFLKRQVTTELLLIIGWAVLMFLEANGLFALGRFSRAAAMTVLIITVVAAIVNLVCYLLYYDLDSTKGFVDGMIPLVLAVVIMLAVTAVVAHSS